LAAKPTSLGEHFRPKTVANLNDYKIEVVKAIRAANGRRWNSGDDPGARNGSPVPPKAGPQDLLLDRHGHLGSTVEAPLCGRAANRGPSTAMSLRAEASLTCGEARCETDG